MIPVAIAVVSALGGALAVLGPVLFVSERRRLLGYLRDEAETLEKLRDHPESAQLVRDSMAATAERYKFLAAGDRATRAGRQFLAMAMTFYTGTLVCLVYIAVLNAPGDEPARKVLGVVAVMIALIPTALGLR